MLIFSFYIATEDNRLYRPRRGSKMSFSGRDVLYRSGRAERLLLPHPVSWMRDSDPFVIPLVSNAFAAVHVDAPDCGAGLGCRETRGE